MTTFTGSLLLDLVALFSTVTAIVYAYYLWAYQYWKRKNVPYIEPKIPFGNLPNPLTSNLSMTENILLLYNEAKSRGWKYCGIYTVAIPSFMVLDLDLLKQIMAKDFSYFTDRGIYMNEKVDRLSPNVFMLGGKRWKSIRSKLTTTFTSGKIKMMFHTVVSSGAILEKYIQEEVAGKEVVDIKDLLGRFTTDTIGSCAFGLDCNSFKDPNNSFMVHGKKAFDVSTLNLAKEAFALNFQTAAKAMGIRMFSKEIEEFYTGVVRDAITYRKTNNVTRNDFLQLLMDMMSKEDGATGDGNTLTMPEIVAQSFIFFIGGFETSSTIMAFALFEMARRQDVQDKVREEIRTVLARHDGQITYDSMNELTYMMQVIEETLRMYPPLPFLTRECVANYRLPGEDVVIEKGILVFIPLVGVHYDERFYPDPEKFDPERFSAENKKDRPPYAHIPFGEGPRVCIGERFGVLQTKVGITSVLKNFRVTLNGKTKLPFKLDPKSRGTSVEGGIWLNIENL